jgi:hypothetical protein
MVFCILASIAVHSFFLPLVLCDCADPARGAPAIVGALPGSVFKQQLCLLAGPASLAHCPKPGGLTGALAPLAEVVGSARVAVACCAGIAAGDPCSTLCRLLHAPALAAHGPFRESVIVAPIGFARCRLYRIALSTDIVIAQSI